MQIQKSRDLDQGKQAAREIEEQNCVKKIYHYNFPLTNQKIYKFTNNNNFKEYYKVKTVNDHCFAL